MRPIHRFRENWRGYLRQYRYWLILATLAGLADMVSTIHFMREAGAENEAHPAIRWVCILVGPVLGPIVGKLAQLLALVVVTVYLRKYAVYIFIPVIILYLWATWYNLWGYQIYYPRILEVLAVV